MIGCMNQMVGQRRLGKTSAMNFEERAQVFCERFKRDLGYKYAVSLAGLLP